jgi:hypothetical protein
MGGHIVVMKPICSLSDGIRRQTHCKAVFRYKQLPVVPRLKRLAAGLSPFISGFILRAIPVTFLEDKMPMGQIFLRVLRLFFGRNRLQILHTRRTANGRIRGPSPTDKQCHPTVKTRHASWQFGTNNKHQDRYMGKL